MSSTYDVIVLGVGGFGSSALYQLARRGARVLGIERFGIAHDRGSSHGQTRIIRQAYFEHPDYVPLLLRAYELWRELEHETNQTLFHQVGMFSAGRPESDAVAGALLAARTHNLPIEQLSIDEARRRFSGYRFPEEFRVVWEERAGYLEVERCVAAHIEAARRHGAQLHVDETVTAVAAEGTGIRVKTAGAEYRAGRVIVTAGPWASQILNSMTGPSSEPAGERPWSDWLQVVRKPLFWFPAGPEFDVAAGNSTFFFETPEGQFYGFPRIDGATVKVAEHTQGDAVADPLSVDRELHPADVARLAGFLGRHMPSVSQQPVHHTVCMYTRTPDCHFIIDRHPRVPGIILGMGFSGHGFKFTTAIGQALAEMALDGRATLPVDFLQMRRLQSR